MLLWKRLTDLRIGRSLRMAYGATIEVETSRAGAVSTIDLAELAALDAIAASDLAKIDGITNGAGAAGKALVLDANGDIAMPATGNVSLARAVLAALGTTSADAAPVVNQVSLVTGADAAKGVVLPAAATGEGPFVIINTAASTLLVYPVDGGNDLINGQAEDLAFQLAGGAMAIFIATSATQWYASTLAGALLPSPLTRSTVTNAATITAAQLAGRVLYQDASGGSVTMTTRTGTETAADFPHLRVGDGVEISLASNHGSNTSTIAGGTDVTLVGSGAVTQTGGQFKLIKTAATTFDLVRCG